MKPAINLEFYDLKRQENRLGISSQVEITSKGQSLHGVTVSISPSGAKFKVPSTFRYNLGEIVVKFTELVESLWKQTATT